MASKLIKVDKLPYGKDRGIIYTKSKIELIPGVTVLVGCNGSGKTTFLNYIKDQIKQEGIPIISYDNLKDGGSNSASKHLFFNNFGFAASLLTSSEGESVSLNVAEFSSDIGNFIRNNKDSKELYILLDGIDSGLSIDSIIEIKELFKLIIETTPNSQVYIIVSANNYEMCNEEQCLDVRTGRYRQFKSYSSYKNFILKSKELKDKRYK